MPQGWLFEVLGEVLQIAFSGVWARRREPFGPGVGTDGRNGYRRRDGRFDEPPIVDVGLRTFGSS